MKIKTKLILVTCISLFVISFLSLNIILNSYSKYKSAEKVQEFVFVSNKIASLIHNIELERGLSARYVFYDDENLKDRIKVVRKNVDSQLKKYSNEIENKKILSSFQFIAKEIKKQRLYIDSFSFEVLETIDFYTNISNQLFILIMELSKKSKNQKISNKISSYHKLLFLKNNIGIERALSSIISIWNFSDEFSDRLREVYSVQSVYERDFKFYATEKDRKVFEEFKKNKYFLEVQLLRETLVLIKDIDRSEELSEYYFDTYTKKIDLFHNQNLEYIKNLKKDVKDYKNKVGRDFVLLITIVITSVLIFSVLIYMLYRRITRSIDSFHEGVASFFDYLNHKKDNVDFLDESSSDEFSDISKKINNSIVSTKSKIDEDKRVLAEAIIILKDFEKGKLYKRLEIDINNPLLKKLKDILNQMANNLETTIEELEHANHEYEMSLDNLKKTQEQLVESEKMASLGGLVAGVAHEINTPIGIGITSSTHFSELTRSLKDKYDNEDMSEEEFLKFLDSSLQLSSLINGNLQKAAELIKSFKQIAVDQTSEISRTFNVKEYLDEILLSINNVTKKTKIAFDIQCDDNIKIKSYPGLLSQIITNLIINSIIHAFEDSEKGIISIYVKIEDNNFKCIYKDDGKGISEENLKKIYDPFFTTNRENGGSGLGMNIIYNIITKQLNGKITCESELNVGTTFNFNFPIK